MHRDEPLEYMPDGDPFTKNIEEIDSDLIAALLAGAAPQNRYGGFEKPGRGYGQAQQDPTLHNAGPAGNGAPNPGPPPQDIFFKLQEGIELLDRCIGMQHIVVLHDKRIGKYYHLGGKEAETLSLLDGTRSVTQIVEALESEGFHWSAEDVQGWAFTMTRSGLASAVDRDGHPVSLNGPTDAGLPAGPPAGLPAGLSGAGLPGGGGPGEPSGAASGPGVPNAAKLSKDQALRKAIGPLGYVISQRIPIGSADRLSQFLLPVVGRLFSPVAITIWVLACLLAISLAWSYRQPLTNELKMMFSPAALPLLAMIWVLTKAIHEIGHAVSAKRCGVRVGKFGLTFFLFAPIPYVDVTDAWRLPCVWSRVRIAMAGVYLEGWSAIVATIAFVLLPEGLAKHFAAQWMMMAGPATWLVNANPLMRMDGYYAFADAINVPNLRMHGRTFWASVLDRVLLGTPPRALHLDGWRRWATIGHAAASLIFQATWMAGLIVAVIKWGGPLGFFVAGVAIFLWCALPVAIWFYRHWVASSDPTGINRRPRLVVCGVIGLLLIGAALNASSPFRRSVPVVVQYRNEQVARAASPGFITEVHVVSGQWVAPGELMMVIQDDNLLLKRDQMKDELEVAVSKQRQLATRGELGAAEAQTETIRSLRQSLAELNESIEQLRVTATRRGVVVSPDLDRQLGRYVKQGDVLLRVADPEDKELLVVFPEAEWAGYSLVFDKNKDLSARLRGGYSLSVKPLPARPRFSDRLPNPSFAGSGGGDIPVIPDSTLEEGFRAAYHVGEAIAMLKPIDSKRLLTGQRGRLYLSDTRTLAERIWMKLYEE